MLPLLGTTTVEPPPLNNERQEKGTNRNNGQTADDCSVGARVGGLGSSASVAGQMPRSLARSESTMSLGAIAVSSVFC